MFHSVRKGRKLWETMFGHVMKRHRKRNGNQVLRLSFWKSKFFTSIINKWRISISQFGLLKYINNKYCTLNIILPHQFLVVTVLNYLHIFRKNRNLSCKSIFKMCRIIFSYLVSITFFLLICAKWIFQLNLVKNIFIKLTKQLNFTILKAYKLNNKNTISLKFKTTVQEITTYFLFVYLFLVNLFKYLS